MSLKCDYCGHTDQETNLNKAGDKCHKCKQGVLCAKGSKGNP